MSAECTVAMQQSSNSADVTGRLQLQLRVDLPHAVADLDQPGADMPFVYPPLFFPPSSSFPLSFSTPLSLRIKVGPL